MTLGHDPYVILQITRIHSSPYVDEYPHPFSSSLEIPRCRRIDESYLLILIGIVFLREDERLLATHNIAHQRDLVMVA